MEFLRPHLDLYAASLNRWSPEDRTNTVGASDVGQCERKVYWTKNLGDPDYGAEPDPEYVDNYGATLRGTMFENVFWAPALKATYGDRLLYSGEEQQTFVSGYLSATPDGLLTGVTTEERMRLVDSSGAVVGAEVMAECKTADPRTNLTEAKVENVYQTHVQMGLVRELTPFKPTHSILSYTNASFWNEGAEFIIPFDPVVFDNAKKRAARIMTAKSVNEMQPEGWIGGGRECEYCPFTRACGVERRNVPDTMVLATLDPAFVTEITDMARAIKQFDEAIDRETSMMRDLQQKLKDRLRDQKVRKVPGVVTWSAVKGKSGYDNKAIREAAEDAGIDTEQFKTEGDPTDRLQIMVKAIA